MGFRLGGGRMARRREVNWKDGERDGLQTKWYENGQKWSEELYKDVARRGYQVISSSPSSGSNSTVSSSSQSSIAQRQPLITVQHPDPIPQTSD